MPTPTLARVERDGLERLRRWRDEQRGVPRAFDRLGAVLIDVQPGSTTVRLPITAELLHADGTASGAVTAMLADLGLTTSVVASLPDLRGVTTASMSVDHLRLPPASGALLVTCRTAPYSGGGVTYCRGEIHTEQGDPVAHIAGWFLPVPAGEVDRIGVVDEQPGTSLAALLQVPLGERFTLTARDGLSNALGTLHGAIGALAASLAAEQALAVPMRPRTSTFSYLRPTPRHGSVEVVGSVLRQGRRTASAGADVTGPDGRLVLRASLLLSE